MQNEVTGSINLVNDTDNRKWNSNDKNSVLYVDYTKWQEDQEIE